MGLTSRLDQFFHRRRRCLAPRSRPSAGSGRLELVEGRRSNAAGLSPRAARLRGPRRGVQPHGPSGSRAVSRRRGAAGARETRRARSSDEGVHDRRPAGRQTYHRAHPGVGVPLSVPAGGGARTRTCPPGVASGTIGDAAGSGPDEAVENGAAGPGTGSADHRDPLVSGLRGLSGLPGLSRVGSVAARPATTTFHNDLGAAAPVPTRGPCAGEPISNSDNTAPRHVWSTGRPVHQASRGQERVRTVEPTVPLHRPRSRGARRGSKSTRRPGYSSLMHTTVLPRPWLCSKSSNALTKSSRGKTRSTRGRITPVARKLMICATFC